MTKDEIAKCKTLVFWNYGKPIECRATGRIINAPTDALTYVEVRIGLFSKKWLQLPLLDCIGKI